MENEHFDGQQADERILYTVLPHPLTKTAALVSIAVLAVFFLLVVMMISTAVPVGVLTIRIVGGVLCVLFGVLGIWYTNSAFTQDRTYITDRRIIRFETVSPFFHTKRALFWNEALKAKAYAPSMIYRTLNIGNLTVEPVMGEGESVRVTNISYYEDLANYIDKILYIVKNNPSSLATLKPFVPKPKGKRD